MSSPRDMHAIHLAQRYDMVRALSSEAIVVTDREGCILEVNDRFRDMTHLPGTLDRECPLTRFIHPEDRSAFLVQMSGGPDTLSSAISVRLLSGDGEAVTVESSSGSLPSGERIHLFRDETLHRRREGELEKRNREAVALYEIGRQIGTSLEVEQLLDMIVKNMSWLLEIPFAGVVLVDPVRNEAVWRAAVGKREGSSVSVSLDHELSIPGEVIRRQVSSNIQNDARRIAQCPMLAPEELVSVLLVPLTHRARTLGVLVAGSREGRVFTSDDERLLVHLADQTALSIENAGLYQASLETAKHLKALSSRLTLIQEEERGRIARELHDGVGQALTAIRLNIDVIRRAVPITEGVAMERINDLHGIIDETLKDIRQMAFELRPAALDDFGLPAALRLYVDRFSHQTGIAVRLISPEDFGRWDQRIEGTLYRIIQESLTNVARHAGASTASVELNSNRSSLTLDVSDDGIGISPNPENGTKQPGGSLGILNMKERVTELNGTFLLTSGKGTGTQIHIEIPIPS